MYFMKVTLRDGRACLINIRDIHSVCALGSEASAEANTVIEALLPGRRDVEVYHIRETIQQVMDKLNNFFEGATEPVTL